MATHTTSTRPDCQHQNALHVTARFWIFRKRYLACFDCVRVLEQLKPPGQEEG